MRITARYGESGDMIGEDWGGGDITRGAIGGVVIIGGDDKIREDGGDNE